MWRLSLLVLFGVSILRADVCSSLPADAPKGLEYWPSPSEGTPPPLSFRVSVKPGGPSFRITVRSRLRDLSAGDIEVARCQDGKRLQLLPVTAEQPINFGRSFHVEDLNFDGYLDFSVLREFASKFKSRSYWVYDPGSGLFVENQLTRKLSENCLGSEWHGGCSKATQIDFDQKLREIRANYIPPFAPCAPNGYRGDRYLVKDNRLILIHKEELTSDNCKVTFSDLIGGTMRVTRVLRFHAQVLRFHAQVLRFHAQVH